MEKTWLFLIVSFFLVNFSFNSKAEERITEVPELLYPELSYPECDPESLFVKTFYNDQISWLHEQAKEFGKLFKNVLDFRSSKSFKKIKVLLGTVKKVIAYLAENYGFVPQIAQDGLDDVAFGLELSVEESTRFNNEEKKEGLERLAKRFAENGIYGEFLEIGALDGNVTRDLKNELKNFAKEFSSRIKEYLQQN